MTSKIRLWYIISFSVSFILILIIISSPTDRYDNEDRDSFAKFKNSVYNDINYSLDSSINNFFEDLAGIEGVYNYAKQAFNLGSNDLEEFVADKWSKNFGRPIEMIIDRRFQILMGDMHNTNKKCIDDLKLKGIDVDSLGRELWYSLNKNMQKRLLELSKPVIWKQIINKGIAIGAGLAVGKLISKSIKSHWITVILSVGIEEFVIAVLEDRLNSELKMKLREDIQKSLYSALYNPKGFFAHIEKNIEEFQDFRRHAVSEASQQRTENSNPHNTNEIATAASTRKE